MSNIETMTGQYIEISKGICGFRMLLAECADEITVDEVDAIEKVVAKCFEERKSKKELDKMIDELGLECCGWGYRISYYNLPEREKK